MASFRTILSSALIVSIVSALVACIFSFSAYVALGPDCAGQKEISGYSAHVVDFFGFPLFTGFTVLSFLSIRRANKDAGALQFQSPRRGHIAWLVGFAFISAIASGSSVARYFAISSFCSR